MDAPSSQPDRIRDDPARGFIAVTRTIADAAGPEGLTVGAIVDRLDERAFGLLILILTLPCLVPALPGAQIIAIPIFLLALQMAAGRSEPWLPGWFLRQTAKKSWLDGVAGFAEKLRWTETVARPRLTFLASGFMERVAALVMALAAITIMLPITNTVPSLAITIMAVGLLQRDGLFVAGGAAIALAWITALCVVVFGLLFGATWVIELAQERFPWLLELFGR